MSFLDYSANRSLIITRTEVGITWGGVESYGSGVAWVGDDGVDDTLLTKRVLIVANSVLMWKLLVDRLLKVVCQPL